MCILLSDDLHGQLRDRPTDLIRITDTDRQYTTPLRYTRSRHRRDFDNAGNVWDLKKKKNNKSACVINVYELNVSRRQVTEGAFRGDAVQMKSCKITTDKSTFPGSQFDCHLMRCAALIKKEKETYTVPKREKRFSVGNGSSNMCRIGCVMQGDTVHIMNNREALLGNILPLVLVAQL